MWVTLQRHGKQEYSPRPCPPILEHMPRRSRRPLMPVAAVLLAVLATALPVGASAATSSQSVPVPVTPTFKSNIEDYPLWQGNNPKDCDLDDKPGITKLARLIRKTYGSDEVMGTSYNACYTSSEHNDGRALDWMIDTANKADMRKAKTFLNWLLATDDHGHKYAMARRLGIMYMIFNHRIWRGYSPRGWGHYSGTNPHTDHIHFSLTYDGSTGRTSFWTGNPLGGPCQVASLINPAPKVLNTPMTYVPVAATRILSTASGVGTLNGACRLFASTSYDSHRIDATVTGVGSVPRKGISAVALQVSMREPNWTSYLTAGPAGGAIPGMRRITTQENQTSSSLMVLPVGADGKVSFYTKTGASDLAVSVVGYYVDPTASPKLLHKVAVDGGDQYDSVSPSRLIDAHALSAQDAVKVPVAGQAGTDPASTAAAVSVTVAAGAGRGNLYVFPSGSERPKIPTLAYGRDAQTVTAMVPIGHGGAVTIENDGQARTVDLDLMGAFEPSALKGGRGYSAKRTPVTVVDTATNLGLPKVGPARARSFSVSRAVSNKAETVLLQVTARHPKQDTRLTFWQAGTKYPGITSLSVAAGQTVSGLVVAKITDGRVRVRNTTGSKLDLTVSVLGSFR